MNFTVVQDWEPINERLIKVKMEAHGRQIIVIGVYGPNEDSPIAEKEKFLEALQDEIRKVKKHQELIIAGDLNGRVGRRDNDSTVGCFGEDTLNDNGERIIAICELNNLRITNGFYKHRNIHKYTWTQPTKKLKSIIDYFITKKETTMKIKDVRVKRGMECGSDHLLLVANIEFPWIKYQVKKTENTENRGKEPGKNRE